jgi:putative transposase
VKLNFIGSRPPIENAYAKNLIGRLRDECLNENWFISLNNARDIIASWRIDYSEGRPHTSLRDLTTREYVENTGETLIAVGLQNGVGLLLI